MRAILPLAAIAAVLACSEPPTQTLGPAFDEAATPAEPPSKGDPVGACPSHFDLVQAYKFRKDMRYVGREPADDNQDTYICLVVTKDPSLNPDGTLKTLGVTVLIDNNIPPDKLGKCPMSFIAVTAFLNTEDQNRNSVVCKAQTEEEGLVVTDDNDS